MSNDLKKWVSENAKPGRYWRWNWTEYKYPKGIILLGTGFKSTWAHAAAEDACWVTTSEWFYGPFTSCKDLPPEHRQSMAGRGSEYIDLTVFYAAFERGNLVPLT